MRSLLNVHVIDISIIHILSLLYHAEKKTKEPSRNKPGACYTHIISFINFLIFLCSRSSAHETNPRTELNLHSKCRLELFLCDLLSWCHKLRRGDDRIINILYSGGVLFYFFCFVPKQQKTWRQQLKKIKFFFSCIGIQISFC